MDLKKKVFTGEIKAVNDNEGTLTAYVSTGGKDRMDEVLEPSGADLKTYRKNPVVLWAHDYSTPPIGKDLWTKKDDKGILSKVKFADTDFAQEIFGLYKEGFMNAFSVGFIPKKWVDGKGDKQASRTYTEWEMIEYSAVPVPANPEALALAMSKGIISEDTKKSLETNVTDEVTDEVTKNVTDEEEDVVVTKTTIDEIADMEMDIIELEQTNQELKNTIALQLEEIKMLQYQVFAAYSEKPEKTLSGMTENEIVQKINDTVSGVIRKVTGKIN